MENTKHDSHQTHTPQERKTIRRCIAIGAILLVLQIGLLSWATSEDSHEERSAQRPQSESSVREFGPSASHEPSSTPLVPSCNEIKRRAIEWKNDNFEIDLGPNSCNGTLTFHNPGMPRKQGELPLSHMPVEFTHNEADITITVGKPDYKIPNWDRHTPRPGSYHVALIKHDTFFELRLTNPNNKPYAMCAPWRPIPLCGEASPRRH